MLLGGLQKTTLIDFPGKIACTVFTVGCNFRCPFCHNRDLVTLELFKERGLELIPERIFFDFLKERKNWLEGVCLSIHGDEPVIIKGRDRLIHLPIKQIWNWGNKKEILKKPIPHEEKGLEGIDCLTKNGFKETSKILRHKTKSLYKIICGPGNYSVLTTGGHSIFTLTKNGLVPKRVDKLKIGEWLLSPRKIESGEKVEEVSVLNYVSCLEENRRIHREKVDYWKKIVSQIGSRSISQLSREYGRTRGTIRKYYRSFKDDFSDLLNEWVIEAGFIRHKTSKCKIPIKIKASSQLGEFLGYAAAEGSVRRKEKSISSYIFTLGNEPKLAKKILILYRRIFYQKSGLIRKVKTATGNWQYDVILGNRIIGELIGNLAGEGFVNKHIPQIIFNAPSRVKVSFLKALILGDGHKRIREDRSQHEYSLKTGSKRLAADVIFLLKTLGIFSWIENDGRAYRVVVSQNGLEKLGIELRLKLKYRFRTRVEGIPKDLLGYALRGQKRISRESLAIWSSLPVIRDKKRRTAAIRYGLLDSKRKLTEKGKRLLFILKLSESWDFKEVKKIEKRDLDSPTYVYDLVVENDHSFVGGTGGLLLHNTGGEPTLQADLPEFCAKIKKLGFKVKLDTNGANPGMVEELLKKGLVDYIALDVKGSLDDDYGKYRGERGKKGEMVEKVKETLRLLVSSGVDFELRTTVVPTLHTEESLVRMGKQVKKIVQSAKCKVQSLKWYLQQFRPKNCLELAFEKIKPYSDKEMLRFIKEMKKVIPGIRVR